jgi:hypothetical protein
LREEEFMPTPRFVRWGVVGAVVAGVAWAVSGVFSTAGYLIESAYAIAEAGMLAALAGLHVLQARSLSRLGTAGFAVAFIGTVLVLLTTLLVIIFQHRLGETLLGLLFESGALGWLVGFVELGGLGWLVGFVLFGIATFRARVLPRWCALLLLLHPFLFLFLVLTSFYTIGGILLGLLWLALGYGLWAWRDTPAEQPSRVR